jgi:Flp pilus assembly pilin Flp
MKIATTKVLHDDSGSTVMEFGLIAPVVAILLLGVMDVGHSYYVRTILDGAMQKVARNSSLDSATTVAGQTVINDYIRNSVQKVAPTATVTPVRRYYKTFSEAANARPEEWYDEEPYDGICNNNETFVDVNENGTWDADGGNDGQGGARDVVIIKVSVSFPRMFPMAGLIGLSKDVVLQSNSILANQPYGEQYKYSRVDQLECD